MGSAKETCPNCNREGISAWAWLFAGWPTYATCSLCDVKIRNNFSPWLNMLFQLIGGVLLIVGAVECLVGNYISGVLGIFLGLASFFLPAYFGKLEVVQ